MPNRYVKLAFHGFEPLTREQRVQTYNDAGETIGRWIVWLIMRECGRLLWLGREAPEEAPLMWHAWLRSERSWMRVSTPVTCQEGCIHTDLLLCCCPTADKREEFDEPDYALIDTLFSLAEAHLFMQVHSGGDVGGAVESECRFCVRSSIPHTAHGAQSVPLRDRSAHRCMFLSRGLSTRLQSATRCCMLCTPTLTQLVEMKDAGGYELLQHKSFADIYR